MNEKPKDTTPWSEETIQKLQEYQDNMYIHPYTCGNPECRDILIPTKDGWVCKNCSYTQRWFA